MGAEARISYAGLRGRESWSTWVDDAARMATETQAVVTALQLGPLKPMLSSACVGVTELNLENFELRLRGSRDGDADLPWLPRRFLHKRWPAFRVVITKYTSVGPVRVIGRFTGPDEEFYWDGDDERLDSGPFG